MMDMVKRDECKRQLNLYLQLTKKLRMKELDYILTEHLPFDKAEIKK